MPDERFAADGHERITKSSEFHAAEPFRLGSRLTWVTQSQASKCTLLSIRYRGHLLTSSRTNKYRNTDSLRSMSSSKHCCHIGWRKQKRGRRIRCSKDAHQLGLPAPGRLSPRCTRSSRAAPVSSAPKPRPEWQTEPLQREDRELPLELRTHR